MRIQLDRIAEEPFRWRDSPEVSVADLGRPELTALSPILWSGEVAKVHPGYRLTARLEYVQSLICTRCLELFEAPGGGDVEMVVLVADAEPGPGEHQLDEEELGLVIVDEPILDTEPILLEQLHLNIPMKPLCREDCAGLCPACGADRNREECECETGGGDPRWEALRELRRN